MNERIEKNGKEFFEDNFRQFGIPIKFIKGFDSPLGETYFFDLENIADYNERNLKDIIKKLSVYSHLTMTFKESKETHFAIFVSNEEKVDLSLYDLLKATNGEKFQFVRNGYFCIDMHNPRVINRIVTLKDSFKLAK